MGKPSRFSSRAGTPSCLGGSPRGEGEHLPGGGRRVGLSEGDQEGSGEHTEGAAGARDVQGPAEAARGQLVDHLPAQHSEVDHDTQEAQDS